MFTQFTTLAKKEGIELIYWNNTPLNLKERGCQEINFDKVNLHWKTDALKNALKHLELNFFKQQRGNTIYDAYKFGWNTTGVKNKIKTWIARAYIKQKPSKEYILSLRKKIKTQERTTSFFKTCKEQIEKINPDLVFCASQRPIAAVAPMEVAKELGIPTACAIYSWDNLPKATLVVEADHYFVWSEHMKHELLQYYPFTKHSQIHITGTPQFENHYDSSLILEKAEFYKKYGLEQGRNYICFSGDDITTSPYDAQYLCDVAEAVEQYNKEYKSKLGIIFRRCPVDFSDRYDWVLKKHQNNIVPIAPLWESIGGNWDKKIPTAADLALQANIADHTQLVINVGSSMVFDYAAHNKPCAYINYNPEGSNLEVKDIHKIYKYVHFQSMPDKRAVLWLDSKETIFKTLIEVLDRKAIDLNFTQCWYKKIVKHPAEEASARMVETLKNLG